KFIDAHYEELEKLYLTTIANAVLEFPRTNNFYPGKDTAMALSLRRANIKACFDHIFLDLKKIEFLTPQRLADRDQRFFTRKSHYDDKYERKENITVDDLKILLQEELEVMFEYSAIA